MLPFFLLLSYFAAGGEWEDRLGVECLVSFLFSARFRFSVYDKGCMNIPQRKTSRRV